MGNLIGYLRQEPMEFWDSSLSDRANRFINDNRKEWDQFIINFARAKKYKDQRYLDIAISKIAAKLDATGKGEELWVELWGWLVENNKNKEEEE